MKRLLHRIRQMVDGMWVQRQIHKHELYEECISCGIVTQTPKTLDVSKRLYYIEGVGQMCRECWETLYPIQRHTGDEHDLG